MSEDAEVVLWGRTIGAVSLEPGEQAAVFQYAPEFVSSGIQVSPLAMPLRIEPYSFPELAYRSFKGLPGMLADSLPDRYGNALIDAWLARQGRDSGSASAVERLCYMGRRGNGALEYAPIKGPEPTVDEDIQIGELVELAAEDPRRARRLRDVAGAGQGGSRPARDPAASACPPAGRGRRR